MSECPECGSRTLIRRHNRFLRTAYRVCAMCGESLWDEEARTLAAKLVQRDATIAEQAAEIERLNAEPACVSCGDGLKRKELEAELASLRSVVERLPKFSNGEPALPGVAYTVHPRDGHIAEVKLDWHDIAVGWTHYDARCEPIHFNVSDAYPTREAALAAGKKEPQQ
jgi:hypothetical protein